MKLAKAIEILELNVSMRSTRMPSDVLDAIRLAIAALTYCVNVRRYPHNADNIPIPGEEPE